MLEIHVVHLIGLCLKFLDELYSISDIVVLPEWINICQFQYDQWVLSNWIG